MADDKNRTGADRKRIAIEREYEVRDRSQILGCTAEQLSRRQRCRTDR
jgi:hypothetical protein